jgi:hypothetical protein
MITTAMAGPDQYHEPYRMYWKPTFGSVKLTKKSADLTEKVVYETFGWGTWVSLARVDAPRTPTGDGMYEHELRFNDELAAGAWCTTDRGYNVIAKDLPSGAYHDDLGERDEFTWGMKTILLNEDHVYDIKFGCHSDAAHTSHEFQQRSQASHCHTPCNQYSTYADETVKPIPSAVGIAPNIGGTSETYDIDGTFGDNPSFESDPTDWHVPNGLKNWTCPGVGGPYHGSCHIRVNPDQGAGGKLRMTFDPPNAEETGVNYNEFIVRCPSAPNQNDCVMRVFIEALDSSGDVVATTNGPWLTVNNNNDWYQLRVTRESGWPTSTHEWRFGVEADQNDVFDADYHQQHYDVPR